MKSLELNLKKRLLIVEYATEADYETEIGLLKALTPSKIIEFGHILEFICSGSELTEEKIRELNIVETKLYGSPPGFCTIAYKYGSSKNGFRPGFCAPNGKQFTDSWISAIESSGFYWGENPIQNAEEYNKALNDNKAWEKRRYSQKLLYFADLPTYKQQMKLYNEVESRTFHPERVIIFEIVEGQS